MRRRQAANIIRNHHGLNPSKHRLRLAHIGGKCVAYITKRPLKPWQRVDQYIVVGVGASWEAVTCQCRSGYMRSTEGN